MTTSVVVNPANHHIEVSFSSGEAPVIMAPNSHTQTFWVYGGKSLTVSEIEPPITETSAQ